MMREPGTSFSLAPEAPLVGSCLGGSCAPGELPSVAMSQPTRDPSALRSGKDPVRRARFAYAGAALGVVGAALVLGGAITLGVVHEDLRTERITRGLWLGTLAVTTPLVALSAHVARKAGGSTGYKELRRVGWLAYALSVSDGALLWAGTFNDVPRARILTIGAGAIGVFALLPHALEAFHAGRSLRMRRFMQRLHASAHGLTLHF